MDLKFNGQPTMLLGLGSIGSEIAAEVYSEVKEHPEVRVCCVDSSDFSFDVFRYIPEEHLIQVYHKPNFLMTVRAIDGVNKWFPYNNPFVDVPLEPLYPFYRIFGRLLYHDALRENRFAVIHDTAISLAERATNKNNAMKICIITSLGGNTGSAMFLQFALLLRSWIKEMFPSLRVEVEGDFLMGNPFYSLCESKTEITHIESNCYASLKELHAINEAVWKHDEGFNFDYGLGTSEGRVTTKPFDCCYLYDMMFRKENGEISCRIYTVKQAILTRLFGNCTSKLENALCDSRTSEDKTRLYHILTNLKGQVGYRLSDLGIYDENLPAENKLYFGMHLQDLEELQAPNGKYYKAHKANLYTRGFGYHIDTRWEDTLQDFVADK